MKINELSKLTSINTETIRMYRNLGFLHPKKLENGYYDYSMQDYASIIHLKKLRAFDFSLQDIHESEHLDSLEEYLSRFKEVEIELHKEIESIQKKIDFIHFEMEHVLSTMSTYDANVSLNQSVDTKIDIYPPFETNQLVDPTTYSNYFLYTTTPIFISKDILNGDVKDEIIETKMNDAFYNDEGLENYKEKVQHYLKAHEDDEAIYKLRHNQVITPDEMKHLENLLWIDLGSKDDYRLHFGDTPITRLIRKIVGLDLSLIHI